MAGLVVGGVTIPVAPGSGSWDWNDAVDRRRAMDGSYRASATGGAARDGQWTTPPVTRANAGIYRGVLQQVAAQMCSGDLIEIPTMCCAELIKESPVKQSSGSLVVLDFALHEQQGKKLLLKYSPGDTITGESFTRSTVGHQLNGNIANPLTQVAINGKRDTHYINSVRSILLEASAPNNLIWTNDFTNAVWVKSNLGAPTTGIADPLGGTSACTLTATGANGTVSQVLSAGSSVIRTNAAWIRRRTGSGVVNLYDQAGLNPIAVALTTNWQRFKNISASAGTGRRLDIIITTSGDAIDVWDGQQDDRPFATSEILATNLTVTRGADSYSMPFTAPPMEMTVYAKFVEKGSALLSAHIFSITSAGSGNPIFMGLTSGGLYFANHINAANVSSGVAVGALEDTVELVFRLFGDGSVDITKSVNGGAATTGTQSAPTPLATAWADDILWLNASGSTTTGFTALQSFKIVAGARSLSEMRAA